MSISIKLDPNRPPGLKRFQLVDGEDAPFGLVHAMIVFGCALGFAFDLAEIAFSSAIAGVFSAPPYAVPPERLSWLLAAAYLGAIAGPPLAGTFADRRGRRAALAATLLAIAVTSFMSAFSPGLAALAICRGLAGVALGAFPPLMITYLTDVLPARLRGPLTMVTVGIAYLGPPALIFAMRWLTPLAPLGFEGWRWVILASGVGALFAAGIFLFLPESRRWQQEADSATTAATPITPDERRRFPLMAALFFLTPWAGVAFPVLTAAILVHRGFALKDSLFFVGFSTFGPCVGAVLAAMVADRIDRRSSLILCALGMAAAAVGFCVSDFFVGLLLTSFVFSLLLSLYTPALYLYASEMVSTRIRGRYTSWLWSINRVAAALSLLVLLPLLYKAGAWPVFSIITLTLLASVALIAAFGPSGRAGQRVG